ncbi:MAG: hypothetical protein R3F61_02865 [Myxococcota bacterium]
MDAHDRRRLRGALTLLHEGVDEGSRFVERHHRRANEAVYGALSAIPPLSAPTRLVESAHGAVLTTTYGSIRAVNRLLLLAGERAVPHGDDPDA